MNAVLSTPTRLSFRPLILAAILAGSVLSQAALEANVRPIQPTAGLVWHGVVSDGVSSVHASQEPTTPVPSARFPEWWRDTPRVSAMAHDSHALIAPVEQRFQRTVRIRRR